MAHSLRKYLSNRGSALFMVLSTMTALMIACMAMYFSVVSSRTTQFATFFREQSYQSALSLNDMVLAGLMDGTLASGDTDLLSSLANLNEGETITTGANGFKSFDSTLSGSDIEQMGAYTMDITRLPNEMVNGSDNMTFDIATTTINNGVADTVHTYVHVALGQETVPNGDNIFAATGYVPNDAYLDAGYFMTDVFFDTEYTYISLFKNACRFVGDLRTGGDLQILKQINPLTGEDKIGDVSAAGQFRPTTWGIRGNLQIGENGAGALSFCSGSKVLVGGDLIFKTDGGMEVTNGSKPGDLATSGSMDIYVLGDLDLGGKTISFHRANLYVYGDIKNGQLKNALNVYVGGTDSSSYKTYTPKKWDSSAPGMSYVEAKKDLNRETYSKTYRKWVINGEDPSKGDYIPELDPNESHKPASKKTPFTPITIKLNNSLGYANGVESMKPTFTIAYGDPGHPELHPDADVICQAGVIEKVVGNFNGNIAPLTVVLDTGDSEDNVLVLRVTGYLAEDGINDGNKVFKWFRECSDGCTVLVKGKGTVVIDVPEDVIYQDCDRQQFLHESWLTLLGCTKTDGTLCPNHDAKNNPCMNMDSCDYCKHLREYNWSGSVADSSGSWHEKTNVHVYNSIPIQKNTALLAKKYIHSNCREGDGCKYNIVDAKDKDGNKIQCLKHTGTYKQTVECVEHGRTSMPDFCPECDKYNLEKAECLAKKDGKTYDAGVCNSRLEKTKVQNSGIALPGGILPRTDIFLVSSSESADIRLANDLKGKAIMQNGFYGFIYAPYMTFKAEGGSGLGSNRLCGGMVVSDYVINDFYAFTNLYPNKMPDELMGESSDIMAGLTDKSWKISLGSY